MTPTNKRNNSKLQTNYYSFSRLLKFLTNSYWDTMEDLNAPKDHYKLAYVIFYWLGTGSLLPWNFFITGKDTLELPVVEFQVEGYKIIFQLNFNFM